MREQVYNRSKIHRERMKKTFDKNYKKEEFQMGDLVLEWDMRNADKGNLGKFDHLWTVHSELVHIVGTMLIL
jgi:hypothetical protein